MMRHIYNHRLLVQAVAIAFLYLVLVVPGRGQGLAPHNSINPQVIWYGEGRIYLAYYLPAEYVLSCIIITNNGIDELLHCTPFGQNGWFQWVFPQANTDVAYQFTPDTSFYVNGYLEDGTIGFQSSPKQPQIMYLQILPVVAR